jgi:CRISP-associated protein Cas1
VVQGRFATSDDVEEGLYVHNVVDEPGGDLPAPDDDLDRFAGRTSRSFWLTSPTLGVSATIDIIEVGADGAVTPVDYKKGSPDRRGRPWPADETQSLLQALLLREAGYRVDRAEIWYAETRHRVTVSVDDTRLTDVRELLLGEDSVVIVDLGDVDSARFTFIGRRRPLPTMEARIL